MRSLRDSKGAATSAALFLIVMGALSASAPAVVAGRRQPPPFKTDKLELVTASGVREIEVEVADTPDKQALGLMFRTSLDDDKGMLFPHAQPDELAMWMRNTYIPLDMVFIRADGVVHRIEARAEPLSERLILSQGPVTAVLELAGGAAERFGLKAGDRVRHAHFSSTPDPSR